MGISGLVNELQEGGKEGKNQITEDSAPHIHAQLYLISVDGKTH